MEKRESRARKWKLFRKQRTLQIFVGCGLAYLLIFNYLPMAGIVVAFKKYSIQQGFSGIFTSKWVGFKYFVEFFTDYNFSNVLTNTLAISFLKLITSFPARHPAGRHDHRGAQPVLQALRAGRQLLPPLSRGVWGRGS